MIQNIAAIASLASSIFGAGDKQSAPAPAPMPMTTGILPQQIPMSFPMTGIMSGGQESAQMLPMTFLDRALQTLSTITTTIQSMVFSVLGMNTSAGMGALGGTASPLNITPTYSQTTSAQTEQKGGSFGELLSRGWEMLKETIMQQGGVLETLIGKGIDKVWSGVGKLTNKVTSWAKKIF